MIEGDDIDARSLPDQMSIDRMQQEIRDLIAILCSGKYIPRSAQLHRRLAELQVRLCHRRAARSPQAGGIMTALTSSARLSALVWAHPTTAKCSMPRAPSIASSRP